jgi:hypothetical protein
MTSQLNQGIPVVFLSPRAHAELVPIPRYTACLSCSPPTINTISLQVAPPYLYQIFTKCCPPMSKFKIPTECSKTLQHLSLYHFIIVLPSPLPNASTSLQPTFNRRMSGHCLGTFTTEKLFPPLNAVSYYSHSSTSNVRKFVCFRLVKSVRLFSYAVSNA